MNLTPTIMESVNRVNIRIWVLLSRNKNIKLMIIHDENINPLSYIVVHNNLHMETETIRITGETKNDAIYNLFTYLSTIYHSVYKAHIKLKRLEVDTKYFKPKQCLTTQEF